jgi:hypothetical protein
MARSPPEVLIDAAGTGDPGFDGLAAVRAEAGRLMAAGRDAIRRALSEENSREFLRSVRQSGGE